MSSNVVHSPPPDYRGLFATTAHSIARDESDSKDGNDYGRLMNANTSDSKLIEEVDEYIDSRNNRLDRAYRGDSISSLTRNTFEVTSSTVNVMNDDEHYDDDFETYDDDSLNAAVRSKSNAKGGYRGEAKDTKEYKAESNSVDGSTYASLFAQFR